MSLKNQRPRLLVTAILLAWAGLHGCSSFPVTGGNGSGDGGNGSQPVSGDSPAGCWKGVGNLAGQYLRINEADGTFVGDQSRENCGEGYFTENLMLQPTDDPAVFSGTWTVYNRFTCAEVARPPVTATLTNQWQTMTIEIVELPWSLLGLSVFSRVDCATLP